VAGDPDAVRLALRRPFDDTEPPAAGSSLVSTLIDALSNDRSGFQRS
jgi:hypothetical protein